MPRPFVLPDLGEGLIEAEIVKVLVNEGDVLAEDAPLLEVETDKATVEIPSPFAGRVARIHVRPGQSVKVGDVLVTFEDAAPARPGRRNATGLDRFDGCSFRSWRRAPPGDRDSWLDRRVGVDGGRRGRSADSGDGRGRRRARARCHARSPSGRGRAGAGDTGDAAVGAGAWGRSARGARYRSRWTRNRRRRAGRWQRESSGGGGISFWRRRF